MTSQGLKVRVASGPSELEDLAKDWGTLPQATTDPLLSHDWLATAAANPPDGATPHFVVVERSGRLAACAPLVETRGLSGQRLEIAGVRLLNEPSGLLFDGDESLECLCQALVSLRRPMVLQRVEPAMGLLSRLRHCRGGHVVEVNSAPALQIVRTGSWDDYIAGRSAECRSGFRRKRQRLAAIGPVEFVALHPSPAEVHHVLGEVFDVEADSWKGRNGSAVMHRPAMRRFIEDVGGRFARHGRLAVNFLRVGGVSAAALIALEHGHRLWELKIGYRDRFGEASPGRLLLWETLRDAFRRGQEGYEFLGSGDGQQQAWANSERRLHTLVYYPNSPAGALAFGADAASHIARRLRGALSPAAAT
jgi:CelD/BcsL family acetyltransferase involved in cellulose biosynthesis